MNDTPLENRKGFLFHRVLGSISKEYHIPIWNWIRMTLNLMSY